MLPRQDVAQALECALKTGGDFAELYAEDTRTSSMTVIGGKLENAVAGRDHGAGIRVFKGMDTVYVYTNDTSREGLLAAAEEAAQAVASTRVSVPGLVLATRTFAENHPVRHVRAG